VDHGFDAREDVEAELEDALVVDRLDVEAVVVAYRHSFDDLPVEYGEGHLRRKLTFFIEPLLRVINALQLLVQLKRVIFLFCHVHVDPLEVGVFILVGSGCRPFSIN